MYNSGLDSLLATLGTILLWVCLISLAIAIFSIVCQWKIFKKAGQPGWAALIPFYNIYVLFKIAWNTNMFWIYLGVVIGADILGNIIPGGFGAFVLFVGYIAVFVLAVMMHIKLTKAFGHGGAFAVGLVLLHVVFMAILAFGNSTYIGFKSDNMTVGNMTDEESRQAALEKIKAKHST